MSQGNQPGQVSLSAGEQALVQGHMLFCGMGDGAIRQTLALLQAAKREYPKGAYLNRIAFPMASFGLVLRGAVQVYMDDIQGDSMLMANVGPGDSFGESIAYLGIDAPVYIRAAADATVLWLNPGSLRMTPMGPDTQALSRRFTAMLARRTLSMNDRIQILSKSTLRGKILALLSQYAQKYGPAFVLPFDRQSLATYLGANRSALSRELSAMRRDGILDFHKNRFIVREPIHPEGS